MSTDDAQVLVFRTDSSILGFHLAVLDSVLVRPRRGDLFAHFYWGVEGMVGNPSVL